MITAPYSWFYQGTCYQSVHGPAEYIRRGFVMSGGGELVAPAWNRDALVTAAEASRRFGDVTVQLIVMWRNLGKLTQAGWRGRSRVYRWGDLVDIERDTRLSRRSSRNEDRDKPEPATCAA